MKKVAISTYWDTQTNYGQLLQAFALQKVLKEFGYIPFIIKYSLKEENSFYSKILNRIRNGISIKKLIAGTYSKRIKIAIENDLNDKIKGRDFDSFRKKLCFTDKQYDSYNEIKKNPPLANIYITGSDQVWASWIRKRTKRIFLLDFGEKNIKRMAYAASFARNSLSRNEISLYKRCLKNFSLLGIREDSGVEICKNIGFKNAIQVVDPTMLLSKEEWFSISTQSNNPVNKEYIFAYMVENPIDNPTVSKVISLLRNQKEPLFYTSSSLYEDKDSNCRPTIEEWINYIYNAKFVATSSFHGVIFSLIMNTPFVVIAKHGKHKQNTRLYSLLQRFNLENRIFDENSDDNVFQNILISNINWCQVNETLEYLRKTNKEILENELKRK